ncbi:hypothetical protein TNCV_4520551 [Trichonephila clavipes]|nr:hypothetical protein TNCV_4520551 [Trichonephila clavipes]
MAPELTLPSLNYHSTLFGGLTANTNLTCFRSGRLVFCKWNFSHASRQEQRGLGGGYRSLLSTTPHSPASAPEGVRVEDDFRSYVMKYENETIMDNYFVSSCD